jgi:glycosyltransferase involved in cell wall biosynthesis
MVQDGDTGRVVTAEDPHALARAIAELADAPEQCEAMADRAHEWVKEHRNWRVVTEGYRAAYDHARRKLGSSR